MFFATLDDELQAAAAIDVDVLCGDTLWRAVHDHVSLTEQVVQGPRDFQSDSTHPVRVFARCAEQTKSMPGRHARPPVHHDVRHPGQRHLLLAHDRVGHAFADHSVAVDGDP